MTESRKPRRGAIDALLERWTRWAASHPWRVLVSGLLLAAIALLLGSRLTPQADFVNLLPSESPVAKRFDEALDRKSRGTGSSTLLVLVEGAERPQLLASVQALEAALAPVAQKHGATLEHGPGEMRAFVEKWRWLYADVATLERVECELGRKIEKAGPGDSGLDDDEEEPCGGDEAAAGPAASATNGAAAPEGAPPPQAAAGAPPSQGGAEAAAVPDDATPLERFQRQVDERVRKEDRFPSGYFEAPDGRLFALLLRAPSRGMGGFGAEALLKDVQETTAKLLASQAPTLRYGFTGEIPSFIAERDALVKDVALVSGLAMLLLLGSIVVFFRSLTSLVHIGLSVLLGTSLAFAFAELVYGHINSATSFLGPIIAGNGINHSIVYMARYRERRGAGDPHLQALVDAATTVRRGTWLAALAAGGAFAALSVTSFRGFSEFGAIGFVGMVSCWGATFALVPASLSLAARFGGQRATQATAPRSFLSGAFARFATERPGWILGGAALLAVVATVPLPAYLSNPWEYNFAKLGSKQSRSAGAGEWSGKSDRLFGTRGSPYLLMADSMDQVQGLADQLLAVDAQENGGRFIGRVETIWNRLGGTPEVVAEKLELLATIREHLDVVQDRLSAEEQKIADEWRPPEYLRALTPADLPPLARVQFEESDGRVGTPFYAYLKTDVSQSNGHNLLRIARSLESLKLPDGRVVPNASRASVFASMISSMERDGPLATGLAFLLVIVVTLLVTRRFAIAATVLGSLLLGILFTVGGAAWFGVRLNFLNFVVLPLTFGIAVEYPINLYERIRASGGVIADGIRSAGGPVFLCSLTTILGYGSLLVGDSQALASFGRYAVAGEVACIAVALLVMPAALQVLSRWSGTPGRVAVEGNHSSDRKG